MASAGMIAALALSGAIGFSLGLIGGGGSIITVPILVYVAGLPVDQAIALSLAIVGTTSAIGAAVQWRYGNVHLQAALVLGVTGMVGAAGGAQLTALIPGPVLLLLFALLMLAVGVRMLRGNGDAEEPGHAECRFRTCALVGLGLGVLTGFLGVGGGFLIVPALLRYARLPMRAATGTSLLIIAVNSGAGFVAHFDTLASLWGVALSFTAIAVGGMLGGLALAQRVQPTRLKAAFGGLALMVAAYLIWMNAGSTLHLLRSAS